MSVLTPNQARFVDEYLIDLNATQAAIRAGYSAKTAHAQGSRLLATPKVSTAISEAQAARSERMGITADRVLAELAKIAFSDVRKAMSWGMGEGLWLTDSVKLDADTAAAIAEVATTNNGLRLKMHDKRAALVDIGRHLGMFVDKHEHSGPGGGPIDVVTTIERTIVRPNPADPDGGGVRTAAGAGEG